MFITFCAGLFNGIMLEGGANWGFDPIWLKKKHIPKLMTSKPRQEIEEELMDTMNHTISHRCAWIARKEHQKNIRESNAQAANY